MSVAPNTSTANNPLSGPLSGDEFSLLMSSLAAGNPPHVAVGVSGGSDSMALVLLLDDWVKSLGGSVLGITVDHGLRNDSSVEAAQVGAWLKNKAINHKIVRWQSDLAQTSAVQARARNARYELMVDVCVDVGIKHLFVAHNMEDQAETFLMRLRHKSGLDGLGAMAKERKLDCNNAITLVRPLLSIPKMRLKDTLKARSQPWIEDPSNNNTQFERVRTRRLLSLLELHEGINPARLVGAASAARMLRTKLERASEKFIENHVTHEGNSGAMVDACQFFATPKEIKGRVLSRLIASYGPKNKKTDYPPSPDKISRIVDWLAGGATQQTGDNSRTLGGCRIARKGGFLVIRPEPPRRKPSSRMVNNVTHEHLSQKSP